MNRLLLGLSALVLMASCQAFVPLSRAVVTNPSRTIVPLPQHENMPASLARQRQSVAPVQTMGLFGLGVPEIGVILVAAAFLLGPQKLAELGKDAGKIAGELKEVPKEFQKGLEEGEKQAKEMKSKVLEEEKSD
jgi:sec-independent protein translocase protein TatA